MDGQASGHAAGHHGEEDFELSQSEIERRKQFLEFGEADVERLKSLRGLAERYADTVIEDLYSHFLAHEETRRFFEDPHMLAHVKAMQREYFLRLTGGDYGEAYTRDRLRVGAVHQRIGLDPKWYLGGYRRYLHAVLARLVESFPGEPQKAIDAYASIEKLVMLDIGIALDTYFGKREEVRIKAQQAVIRELSTPVLQLRDRLLLLPIIGVLDSVRARQLTEQLLHSIRAGRALVVVLDITGVATVDSKVANHLIQTVEAVRLMGANAIVTGLSAEVAQTLVRIGVDLTKVRTVADLQGGIEEAERLMGYRVERVALSAPRRA